MLSALVSIVLMLVLAAIVIIIVSKLGLGLEVDGFGGAFIAAIFALLLVFVGLKLLVEEPISDQLMPTLALFVSGQQLIIIKKTDRAVFDFQHHAFAGHVVRQDITVGFIGDLAVAINFAEYLQRCIIVACRQRP